MSKPKKMSLHTFLSHFTKDERPDRRYCFIIGAGASKQSGIPTGGELAETWLREIKDINSSEDVNQWMKKEGIDEKNPAPHYPQIYDKRFEIDPKEGFFALAKTIAGREPSCGYSVLVQVLANSDHNVAITTNFDSMIEDAMFTYTQKKPLVCGHESLTSFITPMITRPLIAKIHRDLFYAPKSSSSDTNELHKSWKKALTSILNIYTPLVIGYGGNDGSLMGFLEELDKIEGGVFWFFREKDGEPAQKIKNLVAKHSGYIVPIEGFDEMMIQMNTRLGYDLLDTKIIELAKLRAKKYKEQIENIQKLEAKGNDTAKALKETIGKRKRDWWSVNLEAAAEKDIEKRDEIYMEGIKEFSQSHELTSNYALFLHRIKKDYDKAEQYYKKALESDPNNTINTGNYALFLHDIKKDYDKAEQYYKKALESDPNNTINTGNYALFLHEIKKDYDKAEQYYKKTLEHDPNKAINTGNYALFLKEIKKDYDKAEQYHKKALELDPNDANARGNYALFLHEIKKDYDKAEQYYKKALELDPNDANARGNYALFLHRIKKNYDKAEQYYKKALELDPNDANASSNYAVFLHHINKNYNKAEQYYKKTLELDPNDANASSNYAVFLKEIKKDYDKAEQYHKKALELDPNHANASGSYAVFLKEIKKDYDKAEQYYKKALEIDPNHANSTGNYAQLLIITDRKEEGKIMIQRALEIKPENTDLLVELWFYMYANYYNEYGETAYEELVKLIDTGARSIGWDFKENIELAKKEGHPFIDKLEKLDRIITEDAPPDNL